MMHRSRMKRTVAAIALILAGGGSASAADPATAGQTIDVMNRLFGRHEGLRANHAKGVVAEGRFTPSVEATELSKASLFAGPDVPVTVRFSNATGVPTIHDGSPRANPHGLAVKFRLADGADLDVVVNSLKFFPVATGEEFRDLLTTVSKTKPDTPRPTPLEQLVETHPAAGKAGATAKTPTSFARQIYNGINAFVFVSRDGTRQPFRFRFVPVQGEEILAKDEAEKRPANYLVDELAARLAGEPAVFKVQVQLAEPGDPTNDGTKPWPDDRRTVEMGTLTITKTVPDNASAEKALLFLPNALTDGIEVSDDPLIDARVQAYAVSFGRRTQ